MESVETLSAIVCVGSGDAASDQRLEMLLALAETVDIRDHGSGGHSQTVGRHAEQIARELGFPVTTADRVRLAGMLHDVGKVGVPGSVLSKPGPLDEAEREQVQKHSEIGAQLIDDPQFADIREWVLAHQERPDGSGYPHGLKAEEIPLEARILAVADAYESMTSKRPYRAAMTHESAQADPVGVRRHRVRPTRGGSVHARARTRGPALSGRTRARGLSAAPPLTPSHTETPPGLFQSPRRPIATHGRTHGRSYNGRPSRRNVQTGVNQCRRWSSTE